MKKPVSLSLSAVAAASLFMFAELSSFSVAGYGVSQGSKVTATATLIDMPKSPIPVVSFTSSNSSVAQVPLSKIASSNGTVVIEVNAVSPGCAQIRASYGGRGRSDDIVVHPSSQATSFTMKVPDQVLPYPGAVDASLTKVLSLSAPDRTGPSGSLTLNRSVWSLSSSNTSVVTVPDSVPQTSTTTTFKIYGKGEGCATITAKLGNQSVSKTVMTRYIGG
jgi:hypothetical protein